MAVVVNFPFSGRDRWSRMSRFHGTRRVMGDAAVCATPDNFPTVPSDIGAEPDDAPSSEGATDFPFPCAGGLPPLPPAAAPASPPQADARRPMPRAPSSWPPPGDRPSSRSASQRPPTSLLRTQSAHKTTTGGGRLRGVRVGRFTRSAEACPAASGADP